MISKFLYYIHAHFNDYLYLFLIRARVAFNDFSFVNLRLTVALTAAIAWIASAGAGATEAATAEKSTGEPAVSGTTSGRTSIVTRLLVFGCPPEPFTIPMAAAGAGAAAAAGVALTIAMLETGARLFRVEVLSVMVGTTAVVKLGL